MNEEIEIWKLIGTTATTESYVSNLGRCKTVYTASGRERITPGIYHKYVGMRWYCHDYVHRHVAREFLPPEGSASGRVLHIDHNPENNRADNLRWAPVPQSKIRRSPRV